VENRVAQRRARVVLTTAALLLLTISGHTAGGGSVDLLGLALVAALSLGLGLAVSTGTVTLSLPRLIAVLVAGQGLLHLVLTFTTGHAAHGSPELPLTAMVAAHGLAALGAALLIRHADDLVARWLAFVSAVIGAGTRLVLTPRGVSARAIAPVSRACIHLDVLLHQVVRRGPPAGMHLLPA
jgi:hypothetical protein